MQFPLGCVKLFFLRNGSGLVLLRIFYKTYVWRGNSFEDFEVFNPYSFKDFAYFEASKGYGLGYSFNYSDYNLDHIYGEIIDELSIQAGPLIFFFNKN